MTTEKLDLVEKTKAMLELHEIYMTKNPGTCLELNTEEILFILDKFIGAIEVMRHALDYELDGIDPCVARICDETLEKVKEILK